MAYSSANLGLTKWFCLLAYIAQETVVLVWSWDSVIFEAKALARMGKLNHKSHWHLLAQTQFSQIVLLRCSNKSRHFHQLCLAVLPQLHLLSIPPTDTQSYTHALHYPVLLERVCTKYELNK